MAELLDLETHDKTDNSETGRMELRFSDELEIEYRAEGDAETMPVIKGYAAVFGKNSLDMGFTETIRQGAFKDSIARGDDVIAKLEHENGINVLGRSANGTLRMIENKKGLYVEIDPPDTSIGRDVVELLRRKDLTKMSFAFRTVEDSWTTKGGKDHRELIKADLRDVAIVTNPAYPQTSVGVRSLEEIAEEGRKILNPEPPNLDADYAEIEQIEMEHDLINRK